MRRFFLLSILLLVYNSIIVSCVNNHPETSEDFKASDQYEFLSSEAPAALTKAELEKVSKVNTFAFKFTDAIESELNGQSFVSSPVSMAFLLGMLAEGAQGITRTEICDALGFGKEGQSEINTFCRDLMVLTTRVGNHGETLEIANAAILDKGFTLHDSYIKATKGYFDAHIASKDFATEDVAKYINDWSSVKTHGRITKVLTENNPAARAYFINALYYTAAWKNGFNSEITKDMTFTGEDGTVRNVKMMAMSDLYELYSYLETEDFQMLSLPFGYTENNVSKERNYSMCIMLPKSGKSLGGILKDMNGEKWNGYISSMTPVLVDILLPRFEAKMDLDVKDALNTIGIHSAFGTSADFSRMTKESIFVDMIKQVTNISVDEAGAEAAAVSIAMMAGASPDADKPVVIDFHADHPFLFAITENTTGAILFLGCYK